MSRLLLIWEKIMLVTRHNNCHCKNTIQLVEKRGFSVLEEQKNAAQPIKVQELHSNYNRGGLKPEAH